MSKLNVKVKHHPSQVNENGQYTIKSIATPQPTKYGTVTDQTNLGRLVNAFGDDTDHWVGKRINVTIGENNQRTIEPVR